MTRPSSRRRGLIERPFLLFGLLLLLPATGFGLVGWTSVVRERALHEREARVEAEDVLALRMKEETEGLAALASREADRPYFVYQRQFVPEETVFGQLDFQPSPLLRAPEDARIRGWFQWEEGRKGPFRSPQVLGPDSSSWAAGFEQTYGPWLRARLAAAPSVGSDERGTRTVEHRLRVVAANEERGQLFEEIQFLQGQEKQAPAGSGPPAPTVTPYLEAFRRRVSDVPVPVRYGPFHYVARAAGRPGPPLVAWRLVFVPGVHAGQREAGRERWLLQGYLLDPGTALPTAWETVGSVRVCRLDRAGETAGDGAALASLADSLDAIVLPGEAAEATADPSLALVALPDRAALAADYVSARTRYFWMLGGVLAVVLIGFVVLTRGMRRELALARRKEDFLAAVTHELKTPLAGIRLHAEMLREGWVSDPEAAKRYAGRLLDESDRLGHLVDQVLDLAALERGVARVHPSP
ncbi:MAG: histidine kinase dimerization/phospho-acceptor domain-containing protein, partial [Planctomycetota bacterium]